MATTKLLIRANRVNKEGKTSIFVRYTHNEKSILISTSEKIAPEFWDANRQVVRRSFRGSSSINQKLKAKQTEIDNLSRTEELRGNEPTVEHIREILKMSESAKQAKKKTLLELYDYFVNSRQRNKDLTKTSADHYRKTRMHLANFEKYWGKTLTLDRIDQKFYKEFVGYLYSEVGHATNTVGNNIKYFKVFMNYITDEGLNTNLAYQKFKKPQADTNENIIYLTKEELDTLVELDLSENQKLERVRDLFVLGCTTGLRFSDYSKIKPSNIKGSYLHINTQKTTTFIKIPLNPYSKAILDKYDNQIPKISNQKLNDYLKELGEHAGFDETVEQIQHYGSEKVKTTHKKYELLSSHDARRTFIIQSLERGMRPEVVMRITGHKKLKTLQKYIKITDGIVEREMEWAWGEQ